MKKHARAVRVRLPQASVLVGITVYELHGTCLQGIVGIRRGPK